MIQTTERYDFRTHYIYATRLERLTAGLAIVCNLPPQATREDLNQVRDKRQLIELTWRSITDEYEIVRQDEEYSAASVLWLPIKTYYLLYHQLCVIDYLLSGQRSALRLGHGSCVDGFTERLQKGEIAFNQPLLNTVHDKVIFKFKEPSGAHLSPRAPDDLIYSLVMKKTGVYKLDHFQQQRGINRRTSKGRAKLSKYVANEFSVSIFDFFYYMRLKSNYRGFRFIEDLPAEATARYFSAYFTIGERFYRALDALTDGLMGRF